MAYADNRERPELIAGLRALAGFLETNPDVPAPKYIDVYVFPPYASDEKKRSEIDVIASLIGSETETSCGHYETSRSFGTVEYRAVAIPASETRED
jgi:hypothetical protein